jgi:hypothetical protein
MLALPMVVGRAPPPAIPPRATLTLSTHIAGVLGRISVPVNPVWVTSPLRSTAD